MHISAGKILLDHETLNPLESQTGVQAKIVRASIFSCFPESPDDWSNGNCANIDGNYPDRDGACDQAILSQKHLIAFTLFIAVISLYFA